MKIAVTARDNKGFNTEVDLRFGRAPYFAIVDSEKMEVKFIENPSATAASGAGVMAAQLIADQNIEAIISGNIGPKAYTGLVAGNIKLYSFTGGSIKEAVEALGKGQLQEITGPTNKAHSGLR